MIPAWLVMGAILVVSVLYVVRTLLKTAAKPIAEQDSSASFLAVRESEVAKELQDGRLTEEEASQLRDDLSNEAQYISKQRFFLIKDVSGARWALSAMVAVVVVGSVVLYEHLGFAKEVIFTEKMQERSATQADISDFLVYRVERYGRAEDWYYLASEQILEQDYSSAIISYQNVLSQLEQGTADYVNVQVELAQAMFYGNGNKVSEEMRALLVKVLKASPDNAKALGLQGIVEFDAGNYKNAILVWQKAILLGQDRQERLDLLSGIAAARKQGAISEEEVPAVITHRVQLQLVLETGQVSSDDIFLVYAKMPEQPMPIAIARISSTEFEVPIVLTNLDNLMPGKTLAQVESVDIVVKKAKQSSSDLTQGEIVGYLPSIPSNSDKIFNVKVTL